MTDLTAFEAYGKTPRLHRQIVVTEKIDGTNAGIVIRPLADSDLLDHEKAVVHEGVDYAVAAQSRTRFVTPGNDNFGFAAWVCDNASELVKLGPGRHFGEWWGQGIQRGYGLTEKRFSLFNTDRWDRYTGSDRALLPACCGSVPVLARAASFDVSCIELALEVLDAFGSQAAPGFAPAEGVVVYHSASRQLFKYLLENDDQPKGAAA
jgi:hypothetical protein